MAEILNAHGSKNDIFVAAMTPRDFASDDDLRGFVRRLCDRGGRFGGDGVYFYDAVPDLPQAGRRQRLKLRTGSTRIGPCPDRTVPG
jgi:diaminopimelate epimerase